MVKIPIEIIELILDWVSLRDVSRFRNAFQNSNLDRYLEARTKLVFNESLVQINKINYNIKEYSLDSNPYDKATRGRVSYTIYRDRYKYQTLITSVDHNELSIFCCKLTSPKSKKHSYAYFSNRIIKHDSLENIIMTTKDEYHSAIYITAYQIMGLEVDRVHCGIREGCYAYKIDYENGKFEFGNRNN